MASCQVSVDAKPAGRFYVCVYVYECVCVCVCVCVDRIRTWNVPLNKVAHAACETVEKESQRAREPKNKSADELFKKSAENQMFRKYER